MCLLLDMQTATKKIFKSLDGIPCLFLSLWVNLSLINKPSKASPPLNSGLYHGQLQTSHTFFGALNN